MTFKQNVYLVIECLEKSEKSAVKDRFFTNKLFNIKIQKNGQKFIQFFDHNGEYKYINVEDYKEIKISPKTRRAINNHYGVNLYDK